MHDGLGKMTSLHRNVAEQFAGQTIMQEQYLRAVPGNSFSLDGFHLLGNRTAKPSPLYGTKPVVLVALQISNHDHWVHIAANCLPCHAYKLHLTWCSEVCNTLQITVVLLNSDLSCRLQLASQSSCLIQLLSGAQKARWSTQMEMAMSSEVT